MLWGAIVFLFVVFVAVGMFFGDEDEGESGWWLLRRVRLSIFLFIWEMEFSRSLMLLIIYLFDIAVSFRCSNMVLSCLLN